MYRLLAFIGIILLLGCGASQSGTSETKDEFSRGPDGLKTPISAVDKSKFSDSVRMRSIVSYLASDELKGRDSGSEGIEKAAEFIESVFEKNGLKPYFKSYRDTLSNFEPTSYNLVGLVKGEDRKLRQEYIIIGAHYDHIGIIRSGVEDKIANGANDNASGTATVLELARYFGTYGGNRRSLLFVLFSAEEKGLLGSKHLAQRFSEQELNLYTMLNFEMTGVPLADKDYLMYLSGYERSNLADICNQYAGEKLIGFLMKAREFQLFQRSDNYPFHQYFGVPSQTYCTFDFTNYDYYHKVGDEAFRLDYGHMSTVVNKMIRVIEGIANDEELEIKYY